MFKIRVDSAIHRYGLIVEGECYILGCVIFFILWKNLPTSTLAHKCSFLRQTSLIWFVLLVKCEKGISVVIIFLCIPYTIHQQITFLGPGITYPNPLLTQFAGGYGRGVVSTYPQETIYTAIRGGGEEALINGTRKSSQFKGNSWLDCLINVSC